jgi:hypothetical protein
MANYQFLECDIEMHSLITDGYVLTQGVDCHVTT